MTADAAPGALLDHLIARRLLVFVGPGGVGKTTLAAALGVAAAQRGKRALVLTIDPARRLASALGLDGLDDELREVHGVPGLPDVQPERLEQTGTLHAAMLDTQASYDALIGRVAPDDALRERILENRVYRAFSRTLARSHAYVAMERLHDVAASEDFDLIILDTPPMRSAFEILDAPGRLTRFLDEGVVRWFLGRLPSAEELRDPSAGGLGSAAALRVLGALAGRELVVEMVTFFRLFASMREGFSERAERVQRLLREERSAFVLVGSVDPAHLDDARFMRDGLIERQLTPAAVLLNRSFTAEPRRAGPSAEDAFALPVRPAATTAAERAAALFPEGAEPAVRAYLEALEALRHRLAAENAQADGRARGFATNLREVPHVLLPELASEVTSLPALADLAALLDRGEIRQ